MKICHLKSDFKSSCGNAVTNNVSYFDVINAIIAQMKDQFTSGSVIVEDFVFNELRLKKIQEFNIIPSSYFEKIYGQKPEKGKIIISPKIINHEL